MFTAALLRIAQTGKIKPQMSIDRWMDIKILVYSQNGTLLSNEKEHTHNPRNMDESQKHYAEQKKPDTK